MNNKLKALLVVIGISGTALVFTALPGVSQEQLMDAGLSDCELAEATVAVYVADSGYDNWRVKAWDCGPDGGLVLDPEAFADAGVISIVPVGRGMAVKAASRMPLQAQERWRREVPGCRCAPALPDGGLISSNCQMATDGGWTTAPPRVHFSPDEWRGTGCITKPCGELGGLSSWPAACGPESM